MSTKALCILVQRAFVGNRKGQSVKERFCFKTRRLALRTLKKEDVPAIQAWRNDSVCSKYQRWDDLSFEEILAFVARFENSRFLSEQEEQHYAICLWDGQIVGELAWFCNPADRCITWGYTIAPAYQRKGFGFELLSELLPETRAAFPLLDVVALVEPENLPSIRLLEKLGFFREGYAEKIHSCIYVYPAKNDE